MIIKELNEELIRVLKHLNYELENPTVIESNRKDLCDYQFDGIFSIAKKMHQSPMEIGEKMESAWKELYKDDYKLKKIEFVKPGFLNFTLSDQYINEILNYMNSHDKFGIEQEPRETYLIDYGGYNIAKPLHVGHLRSAIVGESIKRILTSMGHKVLGDVHLGDYGLQIGQVIYGLKEENIKPEEITLEKLEEIYPRISGLCKENEEIKEKCADITKKMQEGDYEYNEYFKVIRKISGDDIKRICNYLDIHFDYWYGESDAYPFLRIVENDLESKKLLYQSEGAYVVDIKEEEDKKELPPLIFKKSNGAYLYASTDLATIYQRLLLCKPDHILYVADLRQASHYESFFRVAKKLGLKTGLEYHGFGTVNGVDGKPYKTRDGKAPKLDDLFKLVKESFISSNEKNTEMSEDDLDIIVNAIIKFADLQNNREKDYIFDEKKFSSVVGKTGPYILYTYVRIHNILKNQNFELKSLNQTIYNQEDRDLRMKYLSLNEIMKSASKERMPSIIANYVYDISVLMNAFYEKNHINNLEDQEKKENWLTVLSLGCNLLKSLLELLAIKIPERM